MPYVVKATVRSGDFAWIKRMAGPYRLGPREHATTFIDPGDAKRAISELPAAIRESVTKFSVESADQTAE